MLIRACLYSLFLFTVQLQAAELSNTLRDHPSPYLALHGNDPVNWQSWGPDVLKRAKEEDKLIYVSSGYFACHWCHVMQRESYQNEAIAAILNKDYIPVKIDRELQPALDEYLIDFVQRTRGSAGWPLNVFITPEGLPMLGLTYAPSAQFKSLLGRIGKAWSPAARRIELKTAAFDAFQEMQQLKKKADDTADIPTDLTPLGEELKSYALRFGDDMEGGFGRQRRFPMAPQLSVLLAFQAKSPDDNLKAFLIRTLDQMASQGLRDHLAGGFYRYTVDPAWQVPHFEKMLYTQALLSKVFIRGAEVLGKPGYLDVARDTLDFSLATLKTSDGAFIASLSAVDADGVEGGSYLWQKSELVSLLNKDELRLATHLWRLKGSAPTEGGYLPVQEVTLKEVASDLGLDSDEAMALKKSALAKLMVARSKRSLPRDDKQLAAWNGLMLNAFSYAAKALDEPRYYAAAKVLQNYLRTQLWDGNKLYRALGPKGWLGQAALEDYAYVADGLHAWSSLSGDKSADQLALTLVKQAWTRFYNKGWLSSDEMIIPGGLAEAALSDGPMQSPGSVLINLTHDFVLQSSDKTLEANVQAALDVSYPAVVDFPFAYPSHTLALLEVTRSTEK